MNESGSDKHAGAYDVTPEQITYFRLTGKAPSDVERAPFLEQIADLALQGLARHSAASSVDQQYAASLADAVENCRVTCKHEPSAFDLEQQGYDTIIRALRLFARSSEGRLFYCPNCGTDTTKSSEEGIFASTYRDSEGVERCDMTGAPAHTDHPARHFDRTCPACVAEHTNAAPQAPCTYDEAFPVASTHKVAATHAAPAAATSGSTVEDERAREHLVPAQPAGAAPFAASHATSNVEIDNAWAERFCEAFNWLPDGHQWTEGKGRGDGRGRLVTFRELARGYIRTALATKTPIGKSATRGSDE